MLLGKDFFSRECLQAAKSLVGKVLVRHTENGDIRLRITETEAYCGEDDTACHAHKGRTKRTETMYREGGTVYVYLCYGMHYMLNIVTGGTDEPQAVLIRACEGFDGPGKLTKKLMIDKSFNGESIVGNSRLCIEDDGKVFEVQSDRRVGINYASERDRERLWRFKLKK